MMMEVYNMMKDKIDIANQEWADHECGIIDRKENDFLTELRAEVNGVFEDEIKRIQDKAKWWPEFQVWLYNREMPLDLVENGKYKFLACRKMEHYISKSGNFNLFKEGNLKEKIAEKVSEILNRDTISIVNEKEVKVSIWLMNKMGIEVDSENEWEAE